MAEKEEFDYQQAMKSLEEIAAKVEDPSTSIDEIEKYVARSEKLVKDCRAYLRGTREKLESLENI